MLRYCGAKLHDIIPCERRWSQTAAAELTLGERGSPVEFSLVKERAIWILNGHPATSYFTG
jgi:hypothetical protein